jgi:hypothetical protein
MKKSRNSRIPENSEIIQYLHQSLHKIILNRQQLPSFECSLRWVSSKSRFKLDSIEGLESKAINLSSLFLFLLQFFQTISFSLNLSFSMFFMCLLCRVSFSLWPTMGLYRLRGLIAIGGLISGRIIPFQLISTLDCTSLNG